MNVNSSTVATSQNTQQASTATKSAENSAVSFEEEMKSVQEQDVVAEENSFDCTIRNFKNLTRAEYLWPSKALAQGVAIDDILEPDSLTESKAKAENFLLEAKPYDKFQFIRKIEQIRMADLLVFISLVLKSAQCSLAVLHG